MKKGLFAGLLMAAFLNIISFTVQAKPDEGMWVPMFMKNGIYADMQDLGLELTPEQIYSINESSLKDAIVGLASGSMAPSGFFCTAEIVSEKGLIFTNHHCGYDAIQNHSTIEHDYLNEGFWAMSMEEELPNEDMTASILIRMDNVTDSIVPMLSDTMSESARSSKIRKIKKGLEKDATEDGKYDAIVKSFFGGNEYYLLVYETYKDVRLVGAPPSNIGKFGGDTDNWMWPRHTGDFTIFRIYTAPDGSPAEYSEDNIPLKPKHHLPISLDGVQEDDFAMIWGFPGSTSRYITSYGVEYTTKTFNPVLIDVMGTQLTIMDEFMQEDPEVNIMYASTHASLANSWKYFIGQNKGVKRLKVKDEKRNIEKDFIAWMNRDSKRKDRYGDVLENLEQGYEEMGKSFVPIIYYNYAAMASDAVSLATSFTSLASALENEKDNPMAVEATTEQLRASVKEHFENYHAELDKKVLAVLMQKFVDDMPEENYPPLVAELNKKYDKKWCDYADRFFKKSVFVSEERVNEFLDNPKKKRLEKDLAYKLGMAMQSELMKFYPGYRSAQQKIDAADRLFIEALRKMNPDAKYYPDANSTLRFTYGTVQDYFPADAIHYDYETTMAGIMEKEDPSDDEFIVADKLKDLYKQKDFGPYGEGSTMPVCFLTTNDITGGNSGSPVVNSRGELIGIAFDGNWEAMSGDIAFEPELQRTINVDIRYVLFVIDKFAGAQNIIDELDIVKTNTRARLSDEAKMKDAVEEKMQMQE